MQRSIATVSLSGTLPDKLEAIAAAGFDGVEIFENDLLYHGGSRATCAACVPIWGWRSPCSSRSATSRAAAATACHVTSTAWNASST